MTKDLLFALGIFISFSKTKKLSCFLDAAKEVQSAIPLTKQATKIYQQICFNGLNKKDFSVVFKYLNEQ
jgi:3-hydroxyisobutyrate dehydrogenase-like beta-hydroxyacid dehydrogenase